MESSPDSNHLIYEITGYKPIPMVHKLSNNITIRYVKWGILTNHADAIDFCQENDGFLPSTTSLEEYGFLFNIFGGAVWHVSDSANSVRSLIKLIAMKINQHRV